MKLHYPVKDARIVQPFGVNQTGVLDFYTRFGLPAHEGVDFHAATGTPVYACADGIVSRVERIPFEGSGSAYGIQVRIEHRLSDATYETIYAHLQAVEGRIVLNKIVTQGDIIGLSDSTGNAPTPHLHLSLKKRGATARGEKQQLGNGLWVVYPSDLVNPTPFFVT